MEQGQLNVCHQIFRLGHTLATDHKQLNIESKHCRIYTLACCSLNSHLRSTAIDTLTMVVRLFGAAGSHILLHFQQCSIFAAVLVVPLHWHVVEPSQRDPGSELRWMVHSLDGVMQLRRCIAETVGCCRVYKSSTCVFANFLADTRLANSTSRSWNDLFHVSGSLKYAQTVIKKAVKSQTNPV